MSLVLWLDALSMTTWMSRSAGTAASTASRNLRNSAARSRGMQRPMAGAGFHVEGGKQARCAVALVVVGLAFGLARAHRQHGLCAVEGLDLGLLVDAQHQGPVGWLKVEPDDVAHLLDEERVGRELERLCPVGLQAEGAPDPVHGGGRHTGGPRH